MTVQYLTRNQKPRLAYVHTPAGEAGRALPLVMFCGGYRSDMQGTKATYLEQQCRARGQAYLRFDYSGHGMSEGTFEEGTISQWLEDALAIFDHVAKGPVILVGSSMGGWIAMLVARARTGLVQGLVGIAAAPDFTEDLYAAMDDEQKDAFEKAGSAQITNDYSDTPYTFTKAFYEDGRKNLILNTAQAIDYSVHLIQGMLDRDVPWETAVKIQKMYAGREVDIVFIDDGDHRLSRPEDLELIDREVRAVSTVQE